MREYVVLVRACISVRIMPDTSVWDRDGLLRPETVIIDEFILVKDTKYKSQSSRITSGNVPAHKTRQRQK